jgi:hypothetical protein
MKAPRWVVSYKAVSDGRLVEIYCSTKREAEAFADMVRKVDSKADPKVVERQ